LDPSRLELRQGTYQRVKHQLHMTRDDIRSRRSFALVGNVRQANSVAEVEVFTYEVRGTTDPEEAKFTRPGLTFANVTNS
jgi:hypothetical protein